MYTIRAEYVDGDSFRSAEIQRDLEFNWDLETAKENLARLKEHYNCYSNRNNYVSICAGNREKNLLEEIKQKNWYTGKYWPYSANLVEKDGSTTEFSVPWCGYFARLKSLQIVSASKSIDSDMYCTF